MLSTLTQKSGAYQMALPDNPALDSESSRSLRTIFFVGASGTFALKVGATGLSYGVALLLARILGMSGYGAYAYAMAWVGLLAVPAALGFDKLLIREVAVYKAQAALQPLRGLLKWSSALVFRLSLGVAFCAAVIVWLGAGNNPDRMNSALSLALLMLPLVSLLRLREAAMQGLQHVVAGQVPQAIIRPAIFIVLLLSIYFWAGHTIDVRLAIACQMAAYTGAYLCSNKLLHSRTPSGMSHFSPTYDSKKWVGSALPMLFFGAMFAVNAQSVTIVLGAITDAESVGVYVVANRLAELVGLVHVAVCIAMGPIVAELYANGDRKRLQRFVTRNVRVMLSLTLPLALGLFLLREWVLGIFGAGFLRGDLALTILVVVQIVNVAMGPVGLLLIMTGHEQDAAVRMGISAVLCVSLCFLLIPRWGIEGAACASALNLIAWNVMLCLRVREATGIRPTLFAALARKRPVTHNAGQTSTVS